VGQTKDKVNSVMEEAQGGVLFIDEAYTLASSGTVFAQEAIDQLVQLMTEPAHLHKTVVIMAGYTAEMDQMLSGANSGLKSRITGRIEFPDWDASDCVEMIKARSAQDGIKFTLAAETLLLAELVEIKSRPGWANARDAILVDRLMYSARAERLSVVAEREYSYEEEDVRHAMRVLRRQRPKGPPGGFARRNQGLRGIIAPQEMVALGEAMWTEGGGRAAVAEATAEAERKVVELEEVFDTEATGGGGGDAFVYAALLEACKQAGYDATHEKRQELIEILKGVQTNQPLFSDIVEPILKKTGLTEPKAMEMLRPQIHRVLKGMEGAVKAEEERREELKRLEVEERRRKEAEHQRIQERLQSRGPCPAGFTWHRCGSGWRCAGGSHYLSGEDPAF
jgi:hypothetical protein